MKVFMHSGMLTHTVISDTTIVIKVFLACDPAQIPPKSNEKTSVFLESLVE
jgi:hypothetical protein